MQVLTYVMTGISVALIVVMFLTFRKIRNVSVKTPLTSIAVGLIGFAIYKAILGASLPSGALWALGLLGVVLGLWQGAKTRVWMENGRRKMQNTMWFIFIWILGYGFSQLLVVTGQAMSMNLGIGALSLSTGITIGAQGIMLIKVAKAKPGSTGDPTPPQPVVQPVRPRPGTANRPLPNSTPATAPQKASGAYWFLAFLPLLGILIGWGTVRKTDRPLASRIFLVNFGLTMILLYNLFQIIVD